MSNAPWIAAAILAYCLWNSLDLLNAWSDAPLERFGWILFLIWISPALMQWKNPRSIARTILLGFGLAFSLFGLIASTNAFSYYGLAIAIASVFPLSLLSSAWLASASGWMPAAGWIAERSFPGAEFEVIFIARLAIVSIGSLCAWRLVK